MKLKAKVFHINTNLSNIDLENSFNKWLMEAGSIKIERQFEINNGNHLIFFYSKESEKQRYQNLPEIATCDSPLCVKCGKPMKIASNPSNGDLFWGCRSYPECRSSKPLSDEDWIKHFGGLPESSKEDDIPF